MVQRFSNDLRSFPEVDKKFPKYTNSIIIFIEEPLTFFFSFSFIIIVPLPFYFLGHGGSKNSNLLEYSRVGPLTDLRTLSSLSRCVKEDTITFIGLYCCGLISRKFCERGTANNLLQTLLYSFPEITKKFLMCGPPNAEKP
jgi:hypothetical protein